jgi:hypothetical protein
LETVYAFKPTLAPHDCSKTRAKDILAGGFTQRGLTFMPAEIPAEIRPMLDAYLKALHAQFPDLLSAFYIAGSIALGAFEPDWSDIDTVAILKRPLTESEFKILESLHRELIVSYDKWQLEVTYLLAEDLGQESHPPRPNFHDGELSMGNFESNEVTWWLLKHKGIALYGDLPDFAADWDKLIEKMHENMNGYWGSFRTTPHRLLWVFSDYGIQWVVLGTLRQVYSFCESDIISKVGAGEYGMRQFPQWRRIIQEAIHLRQNKERLYKNRLRRAVDASRFLNFIIRISNER